MTTYRLNVSKSGYTSVTDSIVLSAGDRLTHDVSLVTSGGGGGDVNLNGLFFASWGGKSFILEPNPSVDIPGSPVVTVGTWRLFDRGTEFPNIAIMGASSIATTGGIAIMASTVDGGKVLTEGLGLVVDNPDYLNWKYSASGVIGSFTFPAECWTGSVSLDGVTALCGPANTEGSSFLWGRTAVYTEEWTRDENDNVTLADLGFDSCVPTANPSWSTIVSRSPDFSGYEKMAVGPGGFEYHWHSFRGATTPHVVQPVSDPSVDFCAVFSGVEPFRVAETPVGFDPFYDSAAAYIGKLFGYYNGSFTDLTPIAEYLHGVSGMTENTLEEFVLWYLSFTLLRQYAVTP